MFPLSQDTYHAQWIDSQTFFMDTIWHDMRFRVEGMVLRGMREGERRFYQSDLMIL